MDEYLPSITVQRGFFTNSFNNKKNYFSFGNTNKGLYQIYKNQNLKTIKNNINNGNNYLIVSNTNKDEINSIKNTTAITYYNRGFSDTKLINNKKNNIFPETFYNYEKNSKIKKYNNILINNYNKVKLMKNINNNINNINNINFRNYNLYLPEVQPDGKLSRTQKGNSLSVSNKENNSNNIGFTNPLFNIKQIKTIKKENSKKNVLYHEKIDCQNIHPIKSKDSLTSIGFLDEKKNKFTIMKNNKNFSAKKTVNIENEKEKEKENKKKDLTTLFKNIKCIKSYSHIKNINIDFNNNLNSMKNAIIQNSKINKSTNIKICPLCHKEKETYKYKYHLSLHPSKILDWLYLGSYRNACDKQEIKDLGINYVLNCALECMESFPPGVKYCHLKLNDSPNFRIINYLDKASAFINQAQSNNGIILVHCQLGISRSTTCVIAYFIKYLGYTAINALNFIKQKRTQVMPNFGFLNQLMIYEKKNLNKDKK